VLATVYQGKQRSVVAVASWAKEAVSITPKIDWKRLGIDPARGVIRAAAIENFQPAAAFAPGEPIPIQPGRGWLLLLEQNR
jgi:hypothetical protein